VPINRKLATSVEWLEQDLMGDKRVFIHSTVYGHPLEWRPAWGSWNEKLRAELAQAWNGSVSPATAVQRAAEAIRIEIERDSELH